MSRVRTKSRIATPRATPWIVALLACLSWAPAASAAPPDLVGQPAADFALRSLANENVRLSEQIGEVVILNFWATWSGGSRQEMPLLEALYKKYHRAGLVLFGINIDGSPDAAEEMVRALSITYPVLLDRRNEVAKAFQVDQLPLTVLIDREGVVRYVSQGFKPGYDERYAEKLRELLNE
jgi:peroxiredoxin